MVGRSGGGTPISLGACPVALDLRDDSLRYGGTDYTYGGLDLSGLIGRGDCAVIGGPTSSAAPSRAPSRNKMA
jgi:hypothetical protein